MPGILSELTATTFTGPKSPSTKALTHEYFVSFSLVEGVNLLVSSLTASAIALDRLQMMRQNTPWQNDKERTKDSDDGTDGEEEEVPWQNLHGGKLATQ